MRELTGDVIAITGASSGIGAASARALVEAGASVVLGARRGSRLTDLASELGPQVVTVEMDVRKPDDSKRLMETAYSRFDRLDGLVANAGIGAYGGIMDLTDDQLHERIERLVDEHLPEELDEELEVDEAVEYRR